MKGTKQIFHALPRYILVKCCFAILFSPPMFFLNYNENLYLSFAIVEITHGVTANRDDIMRTENINSKAHTNIMV